MDAQRRNANYCSLGVPEHTCQFVVLVYNNFTSESEITVEPCSPKASTIKLNIHLLIAKFILELIAGSKFNYRRVSMTSSNLEKANILLSLCSNMECDNSRTISCKIVGFSSLEIPFISFLNQFESSSFTLIHDVLNSMEMRGACSQSLKDLFAVFLTLSKE